MLIKAMIFFTTIESEEPNVTHDITLWRNLRCH